MVPLNIFTFHRLEYICWKYICLIEIWITWFQNKLAIPQLKIPHMNFKKINIQFPAILLVVRIWKYYAPNERITNSQNDSELPRTAILASHFIGLADMFSQLGSCHLQLWWSSDKILATDAGGQSSNPGCEVYFSWWLLGSLGSNLVFIIPFGI